VNGSKVCSPGRKRLANRELAVALVGATGTVGSQIAELIVQRSLPYSQLKLFASDSSDRVVDVGERTLPVHGFAGPEELSAFDVVFLAIPNALAAQITQARPGPLLIDLSAATFLPDDTRVLLAPGLTTRERIVRAKRTAVFAVPHPAAQLIATILQAIGSDATAGASIMLSASAGGHQSISDLFEQSADVLNARLDVDDKTQLAFNVFRPPESDQLSRAIAGQVRALLNRNAYLLLNVVRVPAFHGSGVALFLQTDRPRENLFNDLRSAPGLIVTDHNDATGFVDAVGQEGAIARIDLNDAGATIWCTFDAARLAALTAVWIAETLAGMSV
jgi:aspartate-semialdehyde dehydrogenase